MDARGRAKYPARRIKVERRMATEVPAALRQLGQAIASHPNPVQVAFCGFDLWVQVLTSGRTKLCNFKTGGKLASENEDETTLVIPITVVGESIVVNFDPTLPPDAFRLAP
jgi:hypothetical protein